MALAGGLLDFLRTKILITKTGGGELSAIVSEISRHTPVTIEPGNNSLLELTFDSGTQGKTLDARSTLPVVLKC